MKTNYTIGQFLATMVIGAAISLPIFTAIAGPINHDRSFAQIHHSNVAAWKLHGAKLHGGHKCMNIAILRESLSN